MKTRCAGEFIADLVEIVISDLETAVVRGEGDPVKDCWGPI